MDRSQLTLYINSPVVLPFSKTIFMEIVVTMRMRKKSKMKKATMRNREDSDEEEQEEDESKTELSPPSEKPRRL